MNDVASEKSACRRKQSERTNKRIDEQQQKNKTRIRTDLRRKQSVEGEDVRDGRPLDLVDVAELTAVTARLVDARDHERVGEDDQLLPLRRRRLLREKPAFEESGLRLRRRRRRWVDVEHEGAALEHEAPARRLGRGERRAAAAEDGAVKHGAALAALPIFNRHVAQRRRGADRVDPFRHRADHLRIRLLRDEDTGRRNTHVALNGLLALLDELAREEAQLRKALHGLHQLRLDRHRRRREHLVHGQVERIRFLTARHLHAPRGADAERHKARAPRQQPIEQDANVFVLLRVRLVHRAEDGRESLERARHRDDRVARIVVRREKIVQRVVPAGAEKRKRKEKEKEDRPEKKKKKKRRSSSGWERRSKRASA